VSIYYTIISDEEKLKRHGAEEPQNDALNPRYTMLNDSANF
jgi:hypothetical protein